MLKKYKSSHIRMSMPEYCDQYRLSCLKDLIGI